MENKKIEFENITVGAKETFAFCVKEEDLKYFATLTGDHSPLHMDESFSKKSRYKGRIVHGILPFNYISILKMFCVEKYTATILRIDARFMKPIYLENDLAMTAEVVDKDLSNKTMNVEITIENKNSGEIAANGFAVVKFEEEGDKVIESTSASQNKDGCILTEHISLSKLTFEEIEEGLAKSISFSISKGHIFKFKNMFGKDNNSMNMMLNILSLNLFSTFSGMCIPGQNAILLGFEINFLKQIPLMNELLLKGEVTKKSEGTRSIKLNLSISNQFSNENYAIGNASIIVNLPPAKMPSMSEIKEKIGFDLKNKVVLITGASQGIGETTAKLFASLGAKVVINHYKNEEDAKRVVNEILENGGDAIALEADVSNLSQVEEMVRLTFESYGKIDILLNNAVRDFLPIEFSKLTWEDIQKDIDVTVKGTFNCCKTIIPIMIKNGGGSIINISSIATDNPPPNQLKYVISKSGMVGIMRGLAAEYASKNIRVNIVVPNFVETDLVANIPKVFRKKIANETPMKRIASPIEIAKAVVFLASSYSSYTTGQRIMVTGGSLPFV